MKKNDIQKLKEMSSQEMERVIGNAREDLRKLKFDLAAGKVKDIRSVSEARKKIARLMTFVRGKVDQGNQPNDRK
ncbi:50S ribosomal protein L29 [Patescibacteria group bacterium]|nr:50S ribosomal protein L29 [Patescibacteria group bacterium]